jgi:hypothetical protein
LIGTAAIIPVELGPIGTAGTGQFLANETSEIDQLSINNLS